MQSLWEHVSAITDNVGPGRVAGGIRREEEECTFQFMDLALAAHRDLVSPDRFGFGRDEVGNLGSHITRLDGFEVSNGSNRQRG